MAKLDFNSTDEKKLVDEVFQNAMEVLSEDDRKLPQVEQVLPLLKRGIGIHHGGGAFVARRLPFSLHEILRNLDVSCKKTMHVLLRNTVCR